MSEQQGSETNEIVRPLFDYLFSEDHNILFGRAILVFVIFIGVGWLFARKGIKNKPEILRRTFTSELFYPVGVVFTVYLIEAFIRYKLRTIEKSLVFFIAIAVVIVFYSLSQIYIKRFRSNTPCNIISIIIIGLIFLSFNRDSQFPIYHFCFESLPIFLTFYIYFTGDVFQAHKKQSSEERDFWDQYTNALNETSTSLIAINTKEYSEFADPTGYRYFIEQLNTIDRIDERDKKDKGAITLVRKRFFVVKGDNYSHLKESLEIKSLSTENDLTDEQRTFKSMIKLHTIFKITTYLVPEGEIDHIIKTMNNLSAKKSKKVLNELDRLIINESNFYKPDEKNGNLFFEPNNKHTEIINEIIKTYGAADSRYIVEQIKGKV